MNNHDGTFREEALLRGLALSDNGQEMAGMGVGIGDYDCDGRLDIVRTHYMNQATGLYHNIGKGEFEDVTAAAGLIHERRYVSWGTGLFDLDNDGNPDIFWLPARFIPSSSRSFPSIRAAARALSFETRATGPSPNSTTNQPASLPAMSAAAARSATSITTATSTSSS